MFLGNWAPGLQFKKCLISCKSNLQLLGLSADRLAKARLMNSSISGLSLLAASFNSASMPSTVHSTQHNGNPTFVGSIACVLV